MRNTSPAWPTSPTLAGYIHHALTGVNAIGVGEASGMFPIDDKTGAYDEAMLDKSDALIAKRGLAWKIRDLLPKPLMAGENAGSLTKEGAALLDGQLAEGLPFAPPEGDVGTGMTATNAVSPRTGNVSAGTSIFAMVVLDHPLRNIYPEIDIVATPAGAPAAMVHCNNCTNDINAWVGMLRETLELFGRKSSAGDLYTALYKKSLEGRGRLRRRAGLQLHGRRGRHAPGFRPSAGDAPPGQRIFAGQLHAFANLRRHGHHVHRHGDPPQGKRGHRLPDRPRRSVQDPGRGPALHGGGLQGAPVTCMETAGEGGPYGMALLASYMVCREEGESLGDYLNNKVFANAKGVTLAPDPEDVKGFEAYLQNYVSGSPPKKPP